MTELARSSRLDLRVAVDEKDLIERAAALTGSSTTDFVRSTALAAARDAVHTHEVVQLTTEGSRAFFDALDNPQPPNKNLRKLAARYGHLVGR